MRQSDHYGNALTTQSPAARDHYDTGVRLFLEGTHGAVDAFTAATEVDPGFALGYAGLANGHMMAGDMPAAKAALAEASARADGTDPREQAHIATFQTMLSGDPKDTRRMTESHVREHPRDAMVAKLCSNVFGLIGFSGEVGREAEMLAYTSALMPHYGDDWWMMSMHALALCENGKIDPSLTLMEQSLSINPRNANGSHFKAHALYEDGQTAVGRAYLADWMVGYDKRSVLHSHLTWHAALWALQDGDDAAMWAAIDGGIGPGGSLGLPINVLTDTAAILYRADMAGMMVDPARWTALSDYAAQYFPNTGQSFVDMHAALAHAMAGDGERLAKITETAKGFAADLVRPVARAWGHIARQDWQQALENLTPIMATHERIGGSRAQRDLLELAYVNVLFKLGQADEARRCLRTRRAILADAPPLAAA